MFKKKKIGLVLGGGSAKGLAHIGVLKVLEENDIKIDMISGASIGGFIGALYLSGNSPAEIEKIAKNLNFKKLIDLGLPREGLIKGEKLEAYLEVLFKDKSFSDLSKPLYVTTVDIVNYEEVVFSKGDLAKAVRASMSVPGMFRPVKNNGRILVDGGVLDNLPVKILKDAGADVIIAVNLSGNEKREVRYETANKEKAEGKSPNMMSILADSYRLMDREHTRLYLERSEADLILNPDLKKVGFADFDKIEEGIKAGEVETKKQIRKIRRLGKRNLIRDLFRKRN